MGAWKTNQLADFPRMNNPILIEGLPGIGNVGKLAVDFIIEELKPKKIFEFSSDTLPNSVFVNENNLIELPTIELYHKRLGNHDILLLAGDVQPSEEVSCYDFSSKVLDIFQKLNGSEIITLGGVGLHSIPKSPRVYCTANSKQVLDQYKSFNMEYSVYGVIGPIVGVTGLLLGLGGKRKIPAVAFLAETLGHPMYLGVKGAKEILKILDKKFTLALDMKKMDKDIRELEEELLNRENHDERPPSSKLRGKIRSKFRSDIAYIG